MQATLTVVAYVVVVEARLLVVRKRQTAKFMFPGGKPLPGEPYRAAVAREVQEELGCRIAAVTNLGKFVTAAANEPNTQLVAYVYQGRLWGKPAPTNEIEELRWITGNETGIELAPLLTDCILPLLRQQGQLHR
ncbi:MAG: NUDIX domain-containing protein [Cyanobacteria bacterium P01_D01_bin.14]